MCTENIGLGIKRHKLSKYCILVTAGGKSGLEKKGKCVAMGVTRDK